MHANVFLKMLCFFTFIFFTVSGCGEQGDGGGPEVEETPAFQAVLTDDLGREVMIEGKPERIVSLAPSKTEMLFALGLGDYIVGVSEYCNYPAQAEDKPKAGSFARPNIEQIVALNPQLVVAVPLQDEELSRLIELEIPVLVLNPATLEEIYDSLELLGMATGLEENARLLMGEMKGRIGEVNEKVARFSGSKPRIYYEVYADPLMSVGRDSVINELIQTAGGENIFADLDNPYPKINAEAVLDRDPEVIVFPNYHGTEGFLENEISERPGWDAITAIKEGRVVGIDPDIVSRSGPRVVEAIEELYAIFYPEKSVSQ